MFSNFFRRLFNMVRPRQLPKRITGVNDRKQHGPRSKGDNVKGVEKRIRDCVDQVLKRNADRARMGLNSTSLFESRLANRTTKIRKLQRKTRTIKSRVGRSSYKNLRRNVMAEDGLSPPIRLDCSYFGDVSNVLYASKSRESWPIGNLTSTTTDVGFGFIHDLRVNNRGNSLNKQRRESLDPDANAMRREAQLIVDGVERIREQTESSPSYRKRKLATMPLPPSTAKRIRLSSDS